MNHQFRLKSPFCRAFGLTFGINVSLVDFFSSSFRFSSAFFRRGDFLLLLRASIHHSTFYTTAPLAHTYTHYLLSFLLDESSGICSGTHELKTAYITQFNTQEEPHPFQTPKQQQNNYASFSSHFFRALAISFINFQTVTTRFYNYRTSSGNLMTFVSKFPRDIRSLRLFQQGGRLSSDIFLRDRHSYQTGRWVDRV